MSDLIEGLTVSSTEPARLRAMGDSTSTEPENYGADFIWDAQGQMWGVQRKELSDYIASLHDGRLGMELQQMARLDHALLIIEGEPRWTTEGTLHTNYGGTFTRDQYHSLRLTIDKMFNVRVYEVSSLTGTMDMIASFVNWSRKTDHNSLLTRPKEKSAWGSADSRDYRIWFLQGVPGVGPKIAAAIDDKLGGSPYTMRISREELLQIEGVGAKTADAIIKAVTVTPPTKKRTRRNRND